MIFIDNKYTKVYFNIIERARTSLISDYVEKHHVVPVSLGGDNAEENLVSLTARQHFICHWLLTKMVAGSAKKKMVFALNMMLCRSTNQHRYRITGRRYELIKKEFNKINPFNDKSWQDLQRLTNHKGKKRSEETKQKLRETWSKNKESRVGENHPRYGKEVSNSTREKMSQSMKGKLAKEKNPMYGKTHSKEVKKFLSDMVRKNPIPKKYLQCTHCQQTVDAGNFKRWHGDKCKLKNQSPGSFTVFAFK